jgi:hypothetical protein
LCKNPLFDQNFKGVLLRVPGQILFKVENFLSLYEVELVSRMGVLLRVPGQLLVKVENFWSLKEVELVSRIRFVPEFNVKNTVPFVKG